jgi:hypothetical protein
MLLASCTSAVTEGKDYILSYCVQQKLRLRIVHKSKGGLSPKEYERGGIFKKTLRLHLFSFMTR